MSNLPQNYQYHVDLINSMTHEEIGSLIRFAPTGHPYMSNELPYWNILQERFKSLGGWTPQLSKHIGW